MPIINDSSPSPDDIERQIEAAEKARAFHTDQAYDCAARVDALREQLAEAQRPRHLSIEGSKECSRNQIHFAPHFLVGAPQDDAPLFVQVVSRDMTKCVTVGITRSDARAIIAHLTRALSA